MTTTSYNAAGLPYQTTDNTQTTPTTTLYDVNGRPIQVTNPDGTVTDTVYDARGRVQYTDAPHLPGLPCNGTETFYDGNGRVIATERISNLVLTVTTANGVSSSAFTSQGGVLAITQSVYDAAGRVTDTDVAHTPGQPAAGHQPCGEVQPAPEQPAVPAEGEEDRRRLGALDPARDPREQRDERADLAPGARADPRAAHGSSGRRACSTAGSTRLAP